ncbi:hypothetical protein N7450_002939 [Penicillium hetheringtonii]|uniref:Zn(2)-C6 fungal-type domain-containing protein n=1 Tax=Penicillium hetheringtonii TaxID=911720 RepID=A0AAD6DWV2_9EURO|nr:hypothetical protein N7450_002939 [Penicillium hetheringtonii]
MGCQEPAPPRRKSCEGCKLAKRRCDLGFPACSRCLVRGSPCIYPGRLPAAYKSIVDEPVPEIPAVETIRPNISMKYPLSTNDSIYVDPALHVNPDSMDYQLDDLALPIQSASLSASVDRLLTVRNFAVACPRTRSLRPLSEIVASHLQFAIDILKNAPKMMVLENQTPWCHPQLYKNHMPKEMQGMSFLVASHSQPQSFQLTRNALDAYSCCSLYMCKNETNAPVIMNLFEARTSEILSSPQPLEPSDMLARTHALLLYQIMRLFDGDIRSHAKSRSLFATLESSVLFLMANVPTPSPSDPTELFPLPIDRTTELWEVWVLHESARRTVLFTYYFIQIYKVLQEDLLVSCDGKLGLEHSWYLSGDLWKAENAFDFAVAWSEKHHHIVCNLDFEPILQNAQPNEVDLFGRMLLVTVLGIDKAKSWFRLRGAIL